MLELLVSEHLVRLVPISLSRLKLYTGLSNPACGLQLQCLPTLAIRGELTVKIQGGKLVSNHPRQKEFPALAAIPVSVQIYGRWSVQGDTGFAGATGDTGPPVYSYFYENLEIYVLLETGVIQVLGSRPRFIAGDKPIRALAPSRYYIMIDGTVGSETQPPISVPWSVRMILTPAVKTLVLTETNQLYTRNHWDLDPNNWELLHPFVLTMVISTCHTQTVVLATGDCNIWSYQHGRPSPDMWTEALPDLFQLSRSNDVCQMETAKADRLRLTRSNGAVFLLDPETSALYPDMGRK